jgi:nucleotide sugar dehydrogenase
VTRSTDPSPAERRLVVVLGLGFVGAAMAGPVASPVDGDGAHRFDVTGVELDTPTGRARMEAINAGCFPFTTSDEALTTALSGAVGRNLRATSDPAAYATADVIVVDVPLDIDWRADEPVLRLEGFEGAIRTIGRHARPGALVLVETTVPPGTTANIVVPVLAEELGVRGLGSDALLVAHSYERVMPGRDYLSSIVNYWRVYAGHTSEAADAADRFLSAVINVSDYPLCRLTTTTASESAKVLENTFRATTIALMDEWSRFAETVGIDLFEVVEAVRMRPTHANLRTPGFGVGGYCLTKDPLFAKLAASELFDSELAFPFSTAAVRVNDRAPLAVLDQLRPLLGGSLDGRRLLLLGISYRADVGDTRYSPSETFTLAAQAEGATVVAHDPLVAYWAELDRAVPAGLPAPDGFDAVVFAVPHDEYRAIDLVRWLGSCRPVLYDAFSVLSDEQRRASRELGCEVRSIGRGEASMRSALIAAPRTVR